jgi:hypothetical protein
MAYADTGEFNVLYPTRRRMATILKRILRNDIVDGEGTLVESIRINARITGFEKLEIQIVAMYYFIFLNNGAFLWNGGVITPRDYVAQFTDELANEGITAEIYSQYTEWLTKKYPLVEAVEVLERNQKLVYTFEALDPPAGFTPGFPLDV